jgi:SAM-dependent methyltransferase
MALRAPSPDRPPYDDEVRRTFESALLGRLLWGIAQRGRLRVLDLGCGDGLVGRILAGSVEQYVGVDLEPRGPAPAPQCELVRQDLREGLGPLGRRPFDLYVASFGLASHLDPAELAALLREVAAAAAAGAAVVIEALGLFSIEWPGIWDVPPGRARELRYRLGERDGAVHPWSARELAALCEQAGLRPLATRDRTLQAGPKLDYWPRLPPVREGLAALLDGDPRGARALVEPLPPLPAHPAARFHHALAVARRALIDRLGAHDPARLAHAVWALEPSVGAGLGHGVLALARATGVTAGRARSRRRSIAASRRANSEPRASAATARASAIVSTSRSGGTSA